MHSQATTARIEIADLPINQTGTLKLELLENGVAKLEGTKEGVALSPGANNLSLALKQVGEVVTPATTADLNISLEISPD